jgi:hypothetical protein
MTLVQFILFSLSAVTFFFNGIALLSFVTEQQRGFERLVPSISNILWMDILIEGAENKFLGM